MTCTYRLNLILVWAAASTLMFTAPGCKMRTAGNATGAGTVEELVEKYETAHRERSVEKLRDILWWESPQAGSRPRKDLEKLMAELFMINLEEVEYLEGLGPDAAGGRRISYVRRRPGRQRQVHTVAGPVYGKLILVGSVGAGLEKRGVRIDPSYVVMQSLDRYYIDILHLIVEEEVASARTGKPSRVEPLPFGANPFDVPLEPGVH